MEVYITTLFHEEHFKSIILSWTGKNIGQCGFDFVGITLNPNNIFVIVNKLILQFIGKLSVLY